MRRFSSVIQNNPRNLSSIVVVQPPAAANPAPASRPDSNADPLAHPFRHHSAPRLQADDGDQRPEPSSPLPHDPLFDESFDDAVIPPDSLEVIANHGALADSIPGTAEPHWIMIVSVYLRRMIAGRTKSEQHYAFWIYQFLLLPAKILGVPRLETVTFAQVIQARVNDDLDNRPMPAPDILPSGKGDEGELEIPYNGKECNRRMRLGEPGNAMKALTLKGKPIYIDEDGVEAKLRALHPHNPEVEVKEFKNEDSLPTIVGDTHADLLWKQLEKKPNGRRGGPSGWTFGMLKAACRDSPENLRLLSILVSDITNNLIPGSVRAHVLSSNLTALEKENGGIRPIAGGEIFYSLASSLVAKACADKFRKILVPHQFGVAIEGGCEAVILDSLHALQRTDKGHQTLLKVDFKNAFNTLSRSSFRAALLRNWELGPLYRIVQFAYGAASPLMSRLTHGAKECRISSEQGVRQGDPLGPALFCLAINQGIRDALEVDINHSVSCKAYMDDVNLIGPPEAVLIVFSRLREVMRGIGLEINLTKTELVDFSGLELPASVTQQIRDLGIQFSTSQSSLLGAAIGKSDEDITKCLRETLQLDPNGEGFRVKEYSKIWLSLISPFISHQAKLLLLRYCCVPKMNYLARVTPPKAFRETALAFDADVIKNALDVLGVSRGSVDSDLEWNNLLKQVGLPLRMGGLGLTRISETSPIAYLAAVAATMERTTLLNITSHSISFPSGPIESSLQDTLSSTLSTVRPKIAGNEKALGLLPTEGAGFQHFFKIHHRAGVATVLKSKHLQKQLSGPLFAGLTHSFKVKGRPANLVRTATDADDTQWNLDVEKRVNLQLRFEARTHAITANGAHTVWSTLPISPEMTLSNYDVEIAGRQLLGCKPQDIMPRTCACCHNNILEPDHYLVCTHTRNSEFATRHNQVSQLLKKTILFAGGAAVLEPSGLSKDDRRRTDLDAQLDNKRFLIDVSIVHPLASSYRKAAAKGPSLVVAKKAAIRKTAKYKALVEALSKDRVAQVAEAKEGELAEAKENAAVEGKENGSAEVVVNAAGQRMVKFVPFILETYGGFFHESSIFCSTVAQFAQSRITTDRWMKTCHEMRAGVAMAIHRGNGAGARACHMMRY